MRSGPRRYADRAGSDRVSADAYGHIDHVPNRATVQIRERPEERQILALNANVTIQIFPLSHPYLLSPVTAA